MEGIPPDKVDAYVREHMLRADSDQDGMLSVGEFMVWFLTEVAGLIPLKRNGAAYHAGAPLYNRFVYYMLSDSGTGVRRKGSGLQLHQLLKMCRDFRVTSNVVEARNGAQVARGAAASDRMLGKMEAGSRLQFVQFVAALMSIAEHQTISADVVLYRMVGDGSHPPTLQTHTTNKTFHRIVLDNINRLFIEGELECPSTPCKAVPYQCTSCGRQHRRWFMSDASTMKAYFKAAGLPFIPDLRDVCSRNVRAVFHRYNARCNKGLPLPSTKGTTSTSQPTSPQAAASPGAGAAGQAAGSSGRQGKAPWKETGEEAGSKRLSDNGSSSGGADYDEGGVMFDELPDLPQEVAQELAAAAAAEAELDVWGSQQWPRCCCLYRSHTLMEMQTWLKVCMDIRTIREGLVDDRCPLTPQRIEAAFMTACSLAGVYCKDTSCGVHDKPLSRAEANTLSAARSPNLVTSGGQRTSTYGTPWDPASTMSASTRRATSARGGSAGSRTIATTVGPSASGTPWAVGLRRTSSAGGPASPRGGEGPATGYSHRAPVPTLNFVQFLEAMRLVAEDLIGHPNVLVNVEMALWRLLHESISVGCPAPKEAETMWGGRTKPRRNPNVWPNFTSIDPFGYS
eukprot:CAMPEP_0202917754 /NCGR_PEP_ID=MMETSP1392-20130828/71759_1 /ASSEMBLY_ACC=CAM_ASM_000868 /TAXON_ID=225041 /ORGANISM="Chlamydomonas chlamydogama, Strain SAG 11-48b" /LENGTH=622 /DNA_ID=CAMNT_0049610613 /DNA_START=267 /DNA_END=2135 /DNA_ORIENTATION=-